MRPEGVEPSTFWSEARRSIQLSYERLEKLFMDKKIFNITLPADIKLGRLDKFLQSKLNNLSRNRIQNLIRNGNVKLNSEKNFEVSKKIRNKDKIEITFPLPKSTKIRPQKIFLNILYDDDDLIIVNKSSGLVVHPGAGNYEKTLVNALLFFYKNKLSGIGGQLRPGIVHRLDKDTSGVLVVAKNDYAHINLSKQFSDHSIKRKYEALIWGSLRPLNGKIVERISRSERNRKLMGVNPSKGKIAITNYKTLEIYKSLTTPKISLIECGLETGRTHQIRVHMNFKGNPIVGDQSYGKQKKIFRNIDPDLQKLIKNLNRQLLHAKSLGFIHPRTKEEVFFEAPRPNDFNNLLKRLKKTGI